MMMYLKEESVADEVAGYEFQQQFRTEIDRDFCCRSNRLPKFPCTEQQLDSSVSGRDALILKPESRDLEQPLLMEQPTEDPLRLEFDLTMEHSAELAESEESSERIRGSAQESYQKNSCAASEPQLSIAEQYLIALGRFSCDVCGERFAWNHALENHRRKHTGEKPFDCKFCGKKFALKERLRIHLRKGHDKVRRVKISKRGSSKHSGSPSRRLFPCEICGRNFTRNYSLNEHAHLHLGTTYRCVTCGQTFKNKRYLTRHTKLHTGGELPSCTVCGKGFIHNGLLRRHMVTHTDERPFHCDICSKNFDQKRNLKRHIMIHMMQGIKHPSCEICGKSLATSRALSKHMRLHCGDRPFYCDICGRWFALSQTLNEHKVAHENEEVFTCEICGKSFNCKSYVKRHIIRIHTNRLDESKDEGPFACKVCKVKYLRKHYLMKHMETKHFQELNLRAAAAGNEITPQNHADTYVQKKGPEIKTESNCCNEIDVEDHKPPELQNAGRLRSRSLTEILGI